MSLMRRIFGGGKPPEGAQVAPSTQFHESQDSDDPASRSAPRRELVQVVLRDTLRRHAIPSDWIDSRLLSVVSRSAVSGLHVHFIVRHGHERLLNYIPAFQTSFMGTIEGFDPRVADWLLSISWEFAGLSEGRWPDAAAPAEAASAAAAGAAAPAQPVASLPVMPAQPAGASAPPVPASDLEPDPDTVPMALPVAAVSPDDEVREDLAALFAIRDAALKDGAGLQPDFEPTRPGGT